MTTRQRLWLAVLLVNFATVVTSTGALQDVAYFAVWGCAIGFVFIDKDKS